MLPRFNIFRELCASDCGWGTAGRKTKTFSPQRARSKAAKNAEKNAEASLLRVLLIFILAHSAVKARDGTSLHRCKPVQRRRTIVSIPHNIIVAPRSACRDCKKPDQQRKQNQSAEQGEKRVLRVKVKVGIPPVSCSQHDDLLHSYGCERAACLSLFCHDSRSLALIS